MTDQAKRQLQRRRKLLFNEKRRQRILILALILILGSGAFVFYKEKFYLISEILTWLQQNDSDKVQASISPVSARGDIYDRNFRPLAATYETYAIYARPLEMDDPSAVAYQLEEILGLGKNQLLTSLKSERGFVWIAKGIDPRMADILKERNLKGIYQVVETKRFYPRYDTAAHAIGFVENGQGLDGIEFHYNTLLRGDEITRAEQEALHFSADTEFSQTTTNLVLNLDLMIQTKIEQFLKKRVKITGAAKGGVLVMDANNGAILAMASYPAFNPNQYWEFSSTDLKNHLIADPVYPGELALIFQQAAAINHRNEKKAEDLDNPDNTETILVLEPEILKRKKLSTAPRIDYVDPEYLDHFTRMVGFGHKPLTDIPLKNEASVSPSPDLTAPSFHTSGMRLLIGFTALLNKGRIVSPHLLHQAYPQDNPAPLEPVLINVEPLASMHPDTSNDLIDFLADKWLGIDSRGNSSQRPMFFESHRFTPPLENAAASPSEMNMPPAPAPSPHIEQSLLLGAIPGRDPKLTMIVLLSYPEGYSGAYPEVLESLGNKISALTPDQDLVQKMLYLAAQPPLVPSPEFWSTAGTTLAADIDPLYSGKRDPAAAGNTKKSMPDVTGKSLRAGLQVLQHFNLDIKVVGSGTIVSQHPAAGSELQDTTECTLKMHQEI